MSFIEKIQNQPRRKKMVILWFSTGAVMVIIIAIWLFSFSRSLSKTKQFGSYNEQEANAESSLPSLFESLKRDFSALKNIFNSGVRDINTKVQDAENAQNNVNMQNNGQEEQQ